MDSPIDRVFVEHAITKPDGFGALYEHFFPRIYNYIRYRVHDAAITDDLTAQVFEKAFAKRHSYNPEIAPFEAWLFAIARHSVYNYTRDQRPWLPLDAAFQRTSTHHQPEPSVIQQERNQQLLDAVRQLPDQQREVVALKFGAELSNIEIARMLDITPNHVGVILYRAVHRLRQLLSAMEES